ncbi:ribosome biogenesis GTPase Der [Candidatus Poribacteria bacterium]|nr:ribosome biogenesis GTPase Der [Candidatus Poribacteria bacterium]MBT5531879.1 ribosome biogenesis GTPase Der [Candidatus Poribacteria bacterium]MBT5712598.1 ribosome biogenesis GTPase Der [Candidatus Poribacteria bacterium]MBT7095817.1 ribosome biogenesis GTPase Der [Candidatus Poribacteria bacterium]
MSVPVVAIVGRPNVGKSSLFNRVVGKFLAVVDDIPGVTRDRLYAPVEWSGASFKIVDTGGVIFNPDDPMIDQVRAQVDIAVREASLVWLVLDTIEGISPADRTVAEMLHRISKPVVAVAHKADHEGIELDAAEMYELGFDEVVPVSSIHRRGLRNLMDATVRRLPTDEERGEEEAEDDVIQPLRVAIVGRPNAGKSSIVNALIGEERVIVDSRPGTTRDAINEQFEWQNASFELIDTAGMRRKAKIDDGGIEQHSVLRATRSIQQSDVSWLVLDVTTEMSHQDKTIAGFVARYGKLCILVANKWDLVEKDNDTFNEYSEWIRHEFRALDYLPIVFTSALTKQRIESLLELSQQLYRTGSTRIPTPLLNEFLASVTMEQSPRAIGGGRRPALKYITQAEVLPPTFVVFTSYPREIQPSYEAYLIRRLREEFDFHGVPIKMVFRDSRPESE